MKMSEAALAVAAFFGVTAAVVPVVVGLTLHHFGRVDRHETTSSPVVLQEDKILVEA
jgi:hypothetical protein